MYASRIYGHIARLEFAGSSQLSTPGTDAKGSQYRPIHQHCRSTPAPASFSKPENRPDPWISSSKTLLSPETNETEYDEGGKEVESDGQKAPLDFTLCRPLQSTGMLESMCRKLRGMPRQYEKRREEESYEKRSRNQSELIDEKRARQSGSLDEWRCYRENLGIFSDNSSRMNSNKPELLSC
jgi:hypothetical protein